MTILAVYREPFSFAPVVRRLPEGETLAGMRARMHGLPDDFDARGTICLNGHPVPRAAWGMIRPKAGAVTEVTFHARPLGGGEDGGKQILALVASIALTAVTGAIVGGKFATASGLFAKGSTSALFLAAGVSLAGSLLLSALIPPPTIDEGKKRTDLGAASAEGNVLEPNGSVPRVVGEMKIYPPLATEPLVYFSGQDEIVEAVYCLAGPHRLQDIRVGAAPLTSLTDVDYELREGWPGDRALSLVRRQARTEALQAELRGHLVSDSDNRTLESATGDTASALPQKQVVATRDAPDEQLLHLVLPQGLFKNADPPVAIRVPFRLRLREIGEDTWIDLPELHYQAAKIGQLRATIRLIWSDDASTTPGASQAEGWVEARISAPGQTAAPVQDDWAADGYFDDGAGDDYLTSSNLASTAVDHVIMDRHEAKIYLDTATFPKGRYEIEIQRGAPVRQADWSTSAYTVSGTVWDLFGYQGTPEKIPYSKEGISDTVYLARSVSVWNEHPAPASGLALIAIKARNRQLERVSCVAGGWVQDWDGTAWRDWVVTDNPAPHLRDIYVGAENVDPVPLGLIDDTGLVAWRAACTSLGYSCNAIIEGRTVDDAARIVASCGYAKPYMAEIWGVTRDYDRSAEGPVQIFTPRNSRGFRWTKAFARVPDGFRVTFRDEGRDYEARQITVFRKGASDDSARIEQVTYEGLVAEADVIARAAYDQAQPESRGTFYEIDAPAEAIVCRRGDLVGVQHDMLTAQAGAGRIVDWEFDGSGDIAAIWLDEAVPVANEPDLHAVADMHAITDMHAIGRKTGAAIRLSDGSVATEELANTTGESARLEFASAISPTGVTEGLLATVGPLGREFMRAVVFAIRPRADFSASLTLVDEAPEIWT